jgi:hypothetical protein
MKSPVILDFPETSTRPLGLQAVGIESTLVFPILDVDGLSSAVLALHKSRICREMVLGFLAHIGPSPASTKITAGRPCHKVALHEWCESWKRIKFGQAKQQWASNVLA